MVQLRPAGIDRAESARAREKQRHAVTEIVLDTKGLTIERITGKELALPDVSEQDG